MVLLPTLPHKRNPEACEQAVVLARLTASLVPAAMAAMSGDNERDSRSLRLEWAVLPEASHYTLSGCEIVRTTLNGLIVHSDRMRENVQVVADQVATERLMMALGQRVGKQTAHELVYELSQAGRRDGAALADLVRADSVGALLDAEELAGIFDPSSYLGRSEQLTMRAVERARSWLDGRTPAS
jgi:adenylosuccinate lyase